MKLVIMSSLMHILGIVGISLLSFFVLSPNIDNPLMGVLLIFGISLATAIVGSLILRLWFRKYLKGIGILSSITQNIREGKLNNNIPPDLPPGEIGDLAQQIGELQTSLFDFNENLKDVFGNIELGAIDSRVKDFGSDFSDTVRTINDFLNNYVYLLENLPHPYLIIDAEQNLSYANKKLRDMGYIPQDFGKSLFELFGDDTAKVYKECTEKAARTGEIQESRTVTDTPTGVVIEDHVFWPIIYDGRVVSYVNITNDITLSITEKERAEKLMAYQSAEVTSIRDSLSRFSKGELRLDYNPNEYDKITYDAHKNFAEIAHELKSGTDEIYDYVDEISSILRSMAAKDLTREIKRFYQGDFYGIKQSIEELIGSISLFMAEIQGMSAQVESASGDIAQSGMQLSANFGQQVNVLGDISQNMTEISEQTNKNLRDAEEILSLSNSVRDSAENGNKKMGSLTVAMGEIKKSSDDISEIVKIIEGIAFQTNLLAINATIEAARAGEMGKGFGVVADEVRTLALRSSRAAKETSDMLDQSFSRVNTGVDLSAEVAEAMLNIIEVTRKESDIIGRIAYASNEQVREILSVTDRIEELYAMSKENAEAVSHNTSISQQMASLSIHLKDMLMEFVLKD